MYTSERQPKKAVRIGSLWYLAVPVLTAGLFTFVPFLHAAIRLRRVWLWLTTVLFALVAVGTIYISRQPAGSVSDLVDSVFLFAFVSAFVVGTTLLARLRHEVYHLDTSPPGTAVTTESAPDADPAMQHVMQAHANPAPAVRDIAYLISRSCNTGWLDWEHGELWLLPHGLVRSSIGLGGTIANVLRHGIGRTVPHPLPHLPVAAFDYEQILAARRTNKVLPYDGVAAATLSRGLMGHGLRLTMTDGRRHQLAWLPRDPAHAVLSETLPAVLRDRLSHR